MEPVCYSEHKPTQALMAAFDECGWTLKARNYPGHAIFAHPLSGVVVGTYGPEWGKTYAGTDRYALRQIEFTYDGTKIHGVFIREGWPTTGAQTRPVSLRRAVEYVRQPWSPKGES